MPAIAVTSEWLGPDQFGDRVLRHMASLDRITEITRRILGETIAFGPVAAGPGGIAKATARGRRGRVTSSRHGDDPCQLRVQVGVALIVTVHLGIKVISFAAHSTVELGVRVRLREPLVLSVAIDEPSEQDITLRMFMPRRTRRLLTAVGDPETEMKRHISDYTREVLGSPSARRYLHIDLAELIEVAWEQNLIGGVEQARPTRD